MVRRAFIAAQFALPFFAALFASRSAQAHIKWFAPYDLNKPPLPIGDCSMRGSSLSFSPQCC
jgi:hypothetical protein